MRISTKSRVKTKKRSLSQNLRKKKFLLMNSGVMTSILGDLGLELNSIGIEPFHWRTILAWEGTIIVRGGTRSDLGARSRNAPCGAWPATAMIYPSGTLFKADETYNSYTLGLQMAGCYFHSDSLRISFSSKRAGCIQLIRVAYNS